MVGEMAAPEIAIIDGRVRSLPPRVCVRSISAVSMRGPRSTHPDRSASNVQEAAQLLFGDILLTGCHCRGHDELRKRQAGPALGFDLSAYVAQSHLVVVGHGGHANAGG
jgi:hypothetical protein